MPPMPPLHDPSLPFFLCHTIDDITHKKSCPGFPGTAFFTLLARHAGLEPATN